jgi:hypothetical protein
MEPAPKLWRQKYIEGMRELCEETMGKVADAINNAPAGHIINASEEKVRDLFADLRQQAFQMGLQMRIDAAEAAFPPSGGRNHETENAQ